MPRLDLVVIHQGTPPARFRRDSGSRRVTSASRSRPRFLVLLPEFQQAALPSWSADKERKGGVLAESVQSVPRIAFWNGRRDPATRRKCRLESITRIARRRTSVGHVIDGCLQHAILGVGFSSEPSGRSQRIGLDAKERDLRFNGLPLRRCRSNFLCRSACCDANGGCYRAVQHPLQDPMTERRPPDSGFIIHFRSLLETGRSRPSAHGRHASSGLAPWSADVRPLCAWLSQPSIQVEWRSAPRRARAAPATPSLLDSPGRAFRNRPTRLPVHRRSAARAPTSCRPSPRGVRATGNRVTGCGARLPAHRSFAGRL